MVAAIIKREGGYVDHPADRGGATKYGITHRTLARYKGRPVTKADVKAVSIELAAEIYMKTYYREPGIDRLPEAIRAFCFDASVNHGPRRSIKFLQEVCDQAGFGPIDVDGAAGPATRGSAKAARDAMGDWLMAALVEQRKMFYRLIVDRDPSQKVFLKGWMNRMKEFDANLPRAA